MAIRADRISGEPARSRTENQQIKSFLRAAARWLKPLAGLAIEAVSSLISTARRIHTKQAGSAIRFIARPAKFPAAATGILLLLVGAGPAAAQTAMSLDTPTVGSTTALTYIGGWALDNPTNAYDGSGGIDAIHVYLFPLPLGDPEWLGAAALGDPRLDVASAICGGDQRCWHAGWHLNVAVPLHAGAARICAYAHSATAGTFNQSACTDATVYSADYWTPEGLPDAGLAVWLDTANFNPIAKTVQPSGWAVVNTDVRPGSAVFARAIVDDWYAFGNAFHVAKYRPDICAAVFVGHCSPIRSFVNGVTPSDTNWAGIQASGPIDVSDLHGWHFVRWYVWTTDTDPPIARNSYPIWFYVN